MTTLDYDALRAQTLETGKDEAVTVNTRALIDKVLARYSGEWTTLRELLQNAADASAQKVSIKLETSPSATVPVPQNSNPSSLLRHVILHHTLKSTVIENDGELFKATDWARLKKIAEGNPDETKIGAFGVGFYSVFADCEEPLVSSGREALAFYWKGDALYTRRLQLPNQQVSKTTFVLPMRNRTSQVPDLLSLCRFLASSLTFVGLQSIELWLDQWRILVLNKKVAPGMEIYVPKELNRKTREGLMHVISVTKEAAQVDAIWLKAMEWNPKLTSQATSERGSGNGARGPPPGQGLRSFFSLLTPSSSKSQALERDAKEEREAQNKILDNLIAEARATLFVHVDKAMIRTSTSSNFDTELERATKKAPPRTTSISLLSASYDESSASLSVGTQAQLGSSKIFETFVPQNGKGRVFIGFTTNQTTGLNIHISTPSVIPTVERESIDLNNRFVRTWNVELLRAAGIVARISWGQEMAELTQKLSNTVKAAGRKRITKDDIAKILPDAVYTHESFSWNETTPSTEVGALMEEAFWTCNHKVPVAILSTQGVLPASHVRMKPEEGLGFVDGIPVTPDPLTKSRLVKKLIEYGVITEILAPDIRNELQNKALDEEQFRLFLTWLAQKLRINEMDNATVKSLINAAVATAEEDAGSQPVILADMKTFLNTARIPPEMPLPPNTLPFKLTKKVAKQDLEMLGFEDLQMVPWLKWLVDDSGDRGQLVYEQDFTRNVAFASAVLPVISKQWDGLSQSSKVTVLDLLSQRTIMPTKSGMVKPSNAYFPSVKLFDDLPVISPLQSVKEKFLVALGVRKTIEIGVVFKRLMDPSPGQNPSLPASFGRWSHVDLIKYLTSVRADIPPTDIARLRSTKICPAETDSLEPTQERFLLSELFEPDNALRELKLPMMQWPGAYRPESPEGRFLRSLGLRQNPSYLDLVDIMSKGGMTQDWALRNRAMKYFVDHHQTKGYASFDHSTVKVPYLPIQGNEKRLALPSRIFANGRAAVLGFDVLRNDLQLHATKFGVLQEPPVAECVKRIITSPPLDSSQACDVFSYMASRVGELKSQHIEALCNASIVPVRSKSSSLSQFQNEKPRVAYVYSQPKMCFLGTGEKYAEIFDFIDLGREANTFLLACGSKHEPSTVELARRLVKEPAGILSALGDSRYLELLRNIAAEWKTLKKDKTLANDMKAAKCLLAYKEVPSEASDPEQEADEGSGVKIWELATASEIVIVNETITYGLFKETLLAAPLEEALEAFYISLGSYEISTLLEQHAKLGSLTRDQAPATKLHRLLLERTRLFLNDYSTDMIKHDFAWLQKHLSVQCVQTISVRLSLRGYPLVRKESRSAIITSDKPVLYIASGKYDTFEVSQVLVPVLLNRSKPQSVVMLEMMLESSLPKLRSRGYNVNRILRVKAAEARVEEEKRLQQLAEEKERIREQEKARSETQTMHAGAAPMPGIFPDSPEPKNASNPETRVVATNDVVGQKPRNFFSGISKHFNFDNVKRNWTQTQRDPPPPYSTQDGQKQVNQPETVTNPHQIQHK